MQPFFGYYIWRDLMKPRWVCALLILVALTLAVALGLSAQGGRQRFNVFNRFGFTRQNEPPPTEFVLARWHYTAGWGGGGWSHDYPTAEEHILQIMKEASGINVDRLSYRIVELGSPEVFKYPFTYISEPGEMELSDQEVVNLRE